MKTIEECDAALAPLKERYRDLRDQHLTIGDEQHRLATQIQQIAVIRNDLVEKQSEELRAREKELNEAKAKLRK